MNLDLATYLASLPSGRVEQTDDLAARLADAWSELDGAVEAAMYARKLTRIEEARWQPPILTFSIERHGATVLGSTRAEIQWWQVNIEERTAEIVGSRIRQLGLRAAAWDARPVAAALVDAIVNGHDDDRFTRLADGSVRIVLTTLIPPGGPKQTLDGRRRRLRRELEKDLARHGWRRDGQTTYRKVDE